MKNLILALIAFYFAGNLHAQKLEWVYTAGGSDTRTTAVTVDRIGNVYATGYFSGQVTFLPGAGQIRLSAEARDIFVIKFNSRGQLLWIAQMGGTGDDQGNAIAVDSLGNVYTTGSFYGNADFNPDPVNAETLTAAGASDIFVSKLDSNGHYVWARHFGSNGVEDGYGIAVDKSGNVYTTGFFSNTVDFDPGPVSAPLTSSGGYDIFISKLNADGDYVWAEKMGGVSEDQGRALVLDDSGNIYTTGHFHLGRFDPAADFDPDPVSVAPMLSNGSYDVFVSKLAPDGSYVWAKNMGGPYADLGRSIAVDKTGNVYTTGYFQDTADFNPGSGSYPLIASGTNDIFVSKLDASGEFVWAEKIGGDQTAEGYAITLDDSANVFLTGSFEGIVDFNPGTGTVNLISIGNSDIFICKWDKDAQYKWAISMGSTGSGFNRSDVGEAIALDKQGNIHTAGGFYSTVDFDPGPGTVNRYASGVSMNMFVHKMAPCMPDSVTLAIDSVCNSISLNGTIYTESGTYTQVLQNTCGLDSVLTIALTIYPSPGTTILNDGITLTAAQADAYQWIDCWNGNLPVNGATGQVFTPAQNGHYAVILTGPGGCRDTSACREFIKGVGITDLLRPQFTVQVYPNPFTGLIQILVEERPLEQAAIRIVNMMGQAVVEKNGVSGSHYSVDMEGFPAGIYFLEITQADKTERVKLVKE